jgi:integrase
MSQFTGVLAEQMNGLIAQKHALGYKYEDNERLLHQFSLMCNKVFPEAITLTEDMTRQWCAVDADYSNKYTQARAYVVNQLGRYMRSIGEDAYILPIELFPNQSVKHTPHIYTPEELRDLFSLLDNLPENEQDRYFKYTKLIFPIIVKMVYFCGMRPAEARNLNVSDVNLKTGELTIRQAKGRNDRLVVMSDDLTQVCRFYNKAISKIAPKRSFFFPSSMGNRGFTKIWLNKHFHKAMLELGINTHNENSPRLYDLRHTFATHCLQKWINEGKNVNSMLLYLSAYMGHANVGLTAYYIHLIPENFHAQNHISPQWYSNLTQEVSDNA